MTVNLQTWSFGRIVGASVLWVLLVVALFVGYVALRIFLETRNAGAAGIGAVAVGIPGELSLVLLFGPPLILTALWIARRRS
jgi:hypothetical protein